jgi:hypothetical protein
LVAEKFISILKNPEKLNQDETLELKKIIEKYPYFQSARSLYLKGLKNQDSFKYNNELKVTAAYTTDRTVLFDFITSIAFSGVEKQQTAQQKTMLSEEKNTLEKNANVSSEKEIVADLSIGKPLSFSISEKHSFGEWLQLTSAKPIVREVKKEEKANTKTSIIDRFIQKNPKINPIEKDKTIAVSVTKNESSNSLMTATLAKVYLEQKKYENAIQAYKILSLKYPEKSGFFADQIKRVQILQKNKS